MPLSPFKKIKYKALMLDVDGTLILNKKDAMPSKKVVEAISQASHHLHVGVATSRPISLVSHIFSHLSLSGPSIINGGAKIIDATSGKIFYRKTLEKSDVQIAYHITQKYKLSLHGATDKKEVRISSRFLSADILGMFIPSLNLPMVKILQKELESSPTLTAHVVPSWSKGQLVISLSHTQATKQHAIFEVAKILGIDTHEIIGVGDGGNDFPLLMACGLKVAMGNAVDDLKAIADYIAPSVEEDGVADVIEKFVL